MVYDLIVVGGGASGIFCAIQTAERNNNARILVLEKSHKLLSKVKVSGGGRCNVTHACFDPHELIKYYPRGQRELLGPFTKFACGDMMGWLDDHKVPTNIEDDGRIFPTTNDSQTIIDCFLLQCKNHNIQINTGAGVKQISQQDSSWRISTDQDHYLAKNIFIATGSSPVFWKLLSDMGHCIVEPVPSLFTFKISSTMLVGLAGIALPDSHVSILDSKFEMTGPLLITHWGLSAPAILKLSAWAARYLHQKNYHFDITVNWLNKSENDYQELLSQLRQECGTKTPKQQRIQEMPKRLWNQLMVQLNLLDKKYGDFSKQDFEKLIVNLYSYKMTVKGKSTFKEEFVSAGGIELKEIDFRTMESKIHKNLYFGGEVLNIDALTGGFNFQAAWTTAYIAAQSIS